MKELLIELLGMEENCKYGKACTEMSIWLGLLVLELKFERAFI